MQTPLLEKKQRDGLKVTKWLRLPLLTRPCLWKYNLEKQGAVTVNQLEARDPIIGASESHDVTSSYRAKKRDNRDRSRLKFHFLCPFLPRKTLQFSSLFQRSNFIIVIIRYNLYLSAYITFTLLTFQTLFFLISLYAFKRVFLQINSHH